MNLQELRAYLDRVVESLRYEDQSLLREKLKDLISVFPFNDYEFILSFLIDRRLIDFNAYEELRSEYIAANRYLHLFGISPRIFGQAWAERYLIELDSSWLPGTMEPKQVPETPRKDDLVSHV